MAWKLSSVKLWERYTQEIKSNPELKQSMSLREERKQSLSERHFLILDTVELH